MEGNKTVIVTALSFPRTWKGSIHHPVRRRADAGAWHRWQRDQYHGCARGQPHGRHSSVHSARDAD
jgi:hypothetical protein